MTSAPHPHRPGRVHWGGRWCARGVPGWDHRRLGPRWSRGAFPSWWRPLTGSQRGNKNLVLRLVTCQRW